MAAKKLMAILGLALAGSLGALSLANQASAQTPPTTQAATVVTLTQSADQQPGKPVVFVAKVADKSGKALGGVQVRFYVQTDAFGPKYMKVAEGTADSAGIAQASFKPTWVGDIKGLALFAGTKDFATSQAEFQFKVVGPVKVHENAKFGLERVRDWAPFVVAALVAVIWLTFVVVIVRVLRAMRSGSEPSRAAGN